MNVEADVWKLMYARVDGIASWTEVMDEDVIGQM